VGFGKIFTMALFYPLLAKLLILCSLSQVWGDEMDDDSSEEMLNEMVRNFTFILPRIFSLYF
jgi:hypothetical protein